jgi:membrane protein implicated in regulation of membrane protease activity
VLLVLGLIALILFGVPWGLVALLAALILEVLEYFFWQRFLRRYRLRSGPETIVGRTAVVIDECAPLGKVRFQGEVWNARASDPVAEGESVRITAVHGLELEVERQG